MTAERRRLADLYQAALIDRDELLRRSKEVQDRKQSVEQQCDALIAQRKELAQQNALCERIIGFSATVGATIDHLDFEQRQKLLRLVVEQVLVRGWRVDIKLRIPLDQPPNPRDPTPSSKDRLRSLDIQDMDMVRQAFEGELAARHLHALHQIGGPGEEHAVSVLDQGEADGGGKMALAGAWRAEDQAVGALGEPCVAGSERVDLGLGDHRHGVEVEGGEGLAGEQPGLPEVAFDTPPVALGELVLDQRGEEAGGSIVPGSGYGPCGWQKKLVTQVSGFFRLLIFVCDEARRALAFGAA